MDDFEAELDRAAAAAPPAHVAAVKREPEPAGQPAESEPRPELQLEPEGPEPGLEPALDEQQEPAVAEVFEPAEGDSAVLLAIKTALAARSGAAGDTARAAGLRAVAEEEGRRRLAETLNTGRTTARLGLLRFGNLVGLLAEALRCTMAQHDSRSAPS